MPKKTAETPTKKVEVELVEPKKRRGRPLATQTHQIITQYSVEKPVDELVNEDEGEALEVVEEAKPSPEETIEKFVEAMRDKASRWDLVVYRFPNYDIDARTDARAPGRERVGKIPFNPKTYEDEITTLFARTGQVNVFLPEVRRDGDYYAWLPIYRTTPPPMSEIPPSYLTLQNGAAVTAPVPALPPVDPFEQMKKTLSLLADVRKLLPEQEYQQVTAQPQINTTEQALLHIMNTNGEVVESITDKLKGLMRSKDSGREIGIMDLILEAIKSDTFPKMITEAKKLLLEVRQVNEQQATPTPSNTPLASTPAPSIASTSEVAQPMPQTNQTNDILTPPPEIQLLNFAIESCARQAPIQETADRIDSYASLNPSVDVYLNLFVGLTPDQALQWLSQSIPQAIQVTQMPHARQWVEDLQKVLLEESEEQESEKENAQ